MTSQREKASYYPWHYYVDDWPVVSNGSRARMILLRIKREFVPGVSCCVLAGTRYVNRRMFSVSGWVPSRTKQIRRNK